MLKPDPSQDRDFWPTVERASAWILLWNDEAGFLRATADFGSGQVRPNDVVIGIDGTPWTNVRVEGEVHHLEGPAVIKDHQDVQDVEAVIIGPKRVPLTCGRKAAMAKGSLFACLDQRTYQETARR